jgi:uncharacterized membrane protein YeaQ/YmgE (transglycosylase-associated protein family)
MDILWWIVVGLIAGWLAKLVVPGREPGGFFATLAIGVVGALLGGWLWRMLINPDATLGFVSAFIGSVILLVLYHAVMGNRRRV